jgi:hypothetical protein
MYATAMLDPQDAAKKLAAASFQVSKAKSAPRAVGGLNVKAAERRFALLLRMCLSFKDHPEFNEAYRRELAALHKAGSPEESAESGQF